MKLLRKTILLLLLIISVFVLYTFISTGYFRTIENGFKGETIKKINITGAEDITVNSQHGFALISATTRKKLSNKEEFGDLYFMDLKEEEYAIKKLTTNFKKQFAPHGISMLKIDSTYKVMVINHSIEGHSLEIFRLENESLIFEKTLTDKSMISPNDIVQIDEERFYFTNDHKYTDGFGKLIEDYGGRSISSVIYFDGKNYKEVANGIAYANGINYDRARKLLFVVSPRNF